MYFEEEVTLEDKKPSYSTPCFGCLSNNRKLSTLGENTGVFYQIFGNVYSENLSIVLLCWECSAVLRKIRLFREKVEHAQLILNCQLGSENTAAPDGLSNLKVAETVTTILNATIDKILITKDYDVTEEVVDTKDETVEETQVDIKDEIIDENFEENHDYEDETHCEDSNVTAEDINMIDTKKITKTPHKKVKKCDVEIVHNGKIKKRLHPDKYILKGIDGVSITNPRKRKKINVKLNDNSDKEETEIKITQNSEEDPDFKLSKHSHNKYDVKKDTTHKKKRKRVHPYKCVYNKVGFKEIPASLEEVKLWMEKDRKSEYYTKEDKKEIRCLICLKVFPNTKIKKKCHKSAHKRNAYFGHENKCDICQLRMKHIENHYQKHHSHIRQCNDCDFQCYSEFYMTDHIKKHKTSLQCPDCMGRFQSKHEFFKHFCICDYCGRKFRSKKDMESHLINNHIPHKCHTCNQWFKTGTIYSSHVLIKHTPRGSEGSYCVTCDIQFMTQKTYESHIRQSALHAKERPNKVEKKRYPCSECDKVLSTAQSRRFHHERIHLNMPNTRRRRQERCTCELCGKSFQKRETLTNHVNAVHLGIRQHACDYCDRRFAFKTVLVNHIRTHTGEKPYQCEHCEAKFAQRVAMVQHVKFVHLKARREKATVSQL